MTDTQHTGSSLAEGLIRAHRGGTPVDITHTPPADTDAAFEVQDRVARALGGIAGWKVGAASPTAAPLYAPILAGRIYKADGPAVPVPRRYAVETEIALVMARGFAAASTAPSADQILAAVGSAHVALELCATRLTDWTKAPALLNLADNHANHALVLGPEVADWRAIDADRQRAITTVAGKVVGDTAGGHTHKGLAELLVRQVAHCVTRRGGLPAGTVITTGSWTGIHWLDAPARVRGEFPGLGVVEAALVAA